MTTQQPIWKLRANLGDVHPLDYGGYFVFEDQTGVYPAEAEMLEEREEGERHYTVYRFSLDRCTWKDGILSDNPYHPDKSAWWAQSEKERAERPQDGPYKSGLEDLAQFAGITAEELIAQFCSEDALERAEAYRLVGQDHGWINLDGYPLKLTVKEAKERYKEVV
jgi:hypothetical protein